MIYQKNKVSVYSIILAGLLTSVILGTLKLKVTVLLIALGYYLLPYLIMFLAFRNTKKDMYAACDLGVLIFSIVGGLSLLIYDVFIVRGPLGLLFIPIYQLLTFLVLHGAIVVLRIFAKDSSDTERGHKDDL